MHHRNLGRTLKGRRDTVVLTKVSHPMGTDHQIQRPDPGPDIEETLSVLTALAQAGKIRAFGTPTMPTSNLVEAHRAAERRGQSHNVTRARWSAV